MRYPYRPLSNPTLTLVESLESQGYTEQRDAFIYLTELGADGASAFLVRFVAKIPLAISGLSFKHLGHLPTELIFNAFPLHGEPGSCLDVFVIEPFIHCIDGDPCSRCNLGRVEVWLWSACHVPNEYGAQLVFTANIIEHGVILKLEEEC